MSNAALDFDTKWNREFAAELAALIAGGSCTPAGARAAVAGMHFSPQQWEAIPAKHRGAIERFIGQQAVA